MRWLLALLLLPVLVVPAEPAAAATPEWAGAGPFTHVYDPGAVGGVPQYVNDHTFFRGPDGTWHLYGITGNARPDGTVPDSDLERSFLHATAPSLGGPWTTQAPALTYDPSYGETHLWAPYVMTDGSGTYYMFYAGGGDPTQAEINLATSTDLYHWTRSPGGPLFHDGFEARDPYVTRIGDRWVMYYEATSSATGGNYVVAYRTSTDLLHWSGRGIAFTDPTSGTGGGDTESPFVVQHDGLWYLFLGPRGGYVGTDVYRSDNPFSFSTSASAGHIWSHAAEVIQDGSTWYVSAAGWWQYGVSLAPLTWSTTAPAAVAGTDDFPDGHGNPVIGRQQNGAMVAFAIAPDRSSISYRAQTAPSSGWGPWTRLGGPVGGLPVVASDPDGRLELFILGPDGANVAHIWQTAPNGGWSAWDPNFGGPASGVAVARNADGRLEVFATGPNDAYVSHRWQTAPNGGWSGWDGDGLGTFAGPVGGTPVITHEADGRMLVLVPNADHTALMSREQTAPSSGWSPWNPTFGGPASSVAAGRDPDGRLEILATAPDLSSIAHRWQLSPNGPWSPWDTSFSGPVGGPPAIGYQSDGSLVALVLGPSGSYVAIRQQLFPTGPWGSWDTSFGGPAATITVSRNADGRLEAFALAPNGANISHRWQLAPNATWSSWNADGTFGGPAGLG